MTTHSMEKSMTLPNGYRNVKIIIMCGTYHQYDYLLLDYPFAYQNKMMKDYLDCCIFIDTPLDIAMARRVLRDMKKASADDIRNEMNTYLNSTRICYVQMLTDILPTSDYVIDGAKELEDIINETMEIISRC